MQKLFKNDEKFAMEKARLMGRCVRRQFRSREVRYANESGLRLTEVDARFASGDGGVAQIAVVDTR